MLPGDPAGNGGSWSIYEFMESLPSVGTVGGWQLASAPLGNSDYHADIAWNDANDLLYVLNFGSDSSGPLLSELSYNQATRSWATTTTVDLGNSLDSDIYGSNKDLALGIDQAGNPMVLAIDSGATQGLHVAYSTSSNLDNWTSTLLDPDTTSSGGSNGNSKADFVSFGNPGEEKVGIIYSQDGSSDGWRFAWHDTAANSSAYGSNWTNELVNDSISIDDHLSAATMNGVVYAVVKSASDALWLLHGSPGQWNSPVQVVSGSQGTSRPILTLDEQNDRIYIAYQESTSAGDVYLKVADASNPVL